jgi:hypothetical protein
MVRCLPKPCSLKPSNGAFRRAIPLNRGRKDKVRMLRRIAAIESHANPSMAKPLKFLYLICRKTGRGRGK